MISQPGPMFWRAAAMQFDTVPNQSYLLGTFQYTAGSGPNSLATINYLKPGSAVGTLTFIQDGVGKMGRNESGLTITYAGAPFVAYIPEPAAFVLLSMGVLGLLAFAWKRWK